MLRASKRVLRPGGRLAFTVVATVDSPAPPATDASDGFILPAPIHLPMVERAGFHDVEETDITAAFHSTAVRWLTAAAELEEDLRSALGDRVFEEKLASRRGTFDAIESGDLCRLLITAMV